MPNVDIEALLIPWFASTLTARAVTDLPADLIDALPVVQVTRIGGPSDDNNPRFDLPTVTVDCYGADRAQASEIAGDVDDALRLTLPGLTLSSSGRTATITRVQTVTGPSWRPYDNTALRRIGATYRLYVKIRP